MNKGRIDFSGQVAIVTGAGRGLGREHALELARRGAAVLVNDLGGSTAGHDRSTEPADEVTREIHALGGSAIACYDSVATSAGGESIVSAAMAAFGRIDILINNAGSLRSAAFERLPDDDLEQLLETHVKGAFYVTRPAFRLMCKQGYGRIVFTSSSAGLFGNVDQSAYGAAKSALIGLMNALSLEGREHGVIANAVLPSAYTRMAQGMEQSKLDAIMSLFSSVGDALGAALEPRFVTPLVAFLCSAACRESAGIYSACLGRYARVFIGTSPGWLAGQQHPATAEDIAAHFPEITAAAGYREYQSILDEYMDVVTQIRERWHA
jgi:NAD(P)-dependent dehydrogenase (short-subunit alcohol dehydrogenase family)